MGMCNLSASTLTRVHNDLIYNIKQLYDLIQKEKAASRAHPELSEVRNRLIYLRDLFYDQKEKAR